MVAVKKFLRNKKSMLVVAVICLGVLLFLGEYYNYSLRAKNTDHELTELLLNEANTKGKVMDKQLTPNSFFGKVEPGEVLFVIVVCETMTSDIEASSDIKSKASKTFTRQLKQMEVIFKTAMLFTTRKLHFMLVTNTVEVFVKLLAIIKDWPDHMTKRLRITRRQTWHPQGTDDMMKDFRTCSAEILFLHQALPDVDAAAYIDTDTLFLRSPSELWSYFELFNQKHIAGMSPCFYYYGKPSFSNKFGYYGKSGINAGVALMNFTRMRSLPFDLTQTYVDIYRKYKKYMHLIDQDIYNHFFSLYSELLYELSCDWNVRHGVCAEEPFPCEPAKVGISLLHGPDVVFFRDYDDSSKVIFETFLKFNITKDDPMQISKLLKTSLENVVKEGKPTICGKVEGFTEMVLHYPAMHLSSSPHAPT